MQTLKSKPFSFVDTELAKHLVNNTTFDDHPPHAGICLNFFDNFDTFWNDHGYDRLITSYEQPAMINVKDKMYNLDEFLNIRKDLGLAADDDLHRFDNNDLPPCDYDDEFLR